MVETSPIIALSEQIAALEASNQEMRESLDQAMLSLQLEDRGWMRLGQALDGQGEGFSLDELKDLSSRIRPHVAITGLISHALWLHLGYVWGKGVNIEGTQAPSGRGAKPALYRFFVDPVNQDSLFSESARGVLQRTRFSDGMVLALCDLGPRKVRLIPLSEITGIKVNPDFPSEIWAYQRTWMPEPGDTEQRVEWIYTKRFTGRKQKSFTANGKTVPVRQGAVIVDLKANAQSGWVLGVPDCAPALPHYNSYVRFMAAGETVTDSRAKLLVKITSRTAAGAANAAAKVAAIHGHGNGVSLAEGNDVSLIQGSERGYDFKTGDPIAALMALSLNVPLSELLMNAQTGGNYASSASLTPAALNAMQIMQREWISWFDDIFEAFDLGRPRIGFDPIQTPDFYRQAQGLTLLSPTLTNEEYRGASLDMLNLAGNPSEEIPTLTARMQAAKQAASPDQGRSNGGGGALSGDKNDLRDDTVSEALKSIQIEDIRELVERLENAANRLG